MDNPSMNDAELKRYIVAQAAQAAANGSRHYGPTIIGFLFPPAAKRARQNIMLALGRKLPVAKCGINAVRDALFSHFAVTGECLSAREDDLESKLAQS